MLQHHRVSINFEQVHPKKLRHNGITLVFLHEALGSIDQWKSFPQLLCDTLGFQGFIYERQGHGKSSELSEIRTADYLHQYAWDELHWIREQVFSPDTKLILVGHSDGGTIALLNAAKFPRSIFAVVTMAAHVINEPETVAGIGPAVEAYQLGKLDGLRKYHGSKTESLFFAWANTWSSLTFEQWNITQDIQSVQCPILAIQGEKDQYGTELQLQLIVKHTPNTEINLLKGCGHHPHLEKSREVVEIISKWLEKWLTLVK